MTAISSTRRNLCLFAGVIGTLQGIAWTILAFLVILLATEAWIPTIYIFELFKIVAYFLFFADNYLTEFIFVGDVVLGFACFYLIASAHWTILSLSLVWVFGREKYKYAQLCLKIWSYMTLILTLVDLALMIILAIDLSSVGDSATSLILASYFNSVLASAMSIVARGYVFLLIHMALVWYFFTIANQLPNGKESTRHQNQPQF